MRGVESLRTGAAGGGVGVGVLCALLLAGSAQAYRGDLCFPFEGWALVAHWHLGSAARSAREGWLRREYNDRTWGRARAGEWLPRAKAGLWIRNAFQFKKHLWKEFIMAPIDLPPGARMFINSTELRVLPTEADLSLFAYLRAGTNILVLVYPPLESRAYKVPLISLHAVSRSTEKQYSLGTLKTWRIRRERIESEIPVEWLKSSNTIAWRALSQPPTIRDDWLPDTPYCLKAVLEVPYFWRKRELAAFLHDIPGEPAVYMNGVRLVDRLTTPARIDLKGHMKFNGKDTLCLVYESLPSGQGGKDGRWGMVAVRWSSSVRAPQVPPGSALLYKGAIGGNQEGVAQALRYVSQVLEVSATPFTLSWAEMEDGVVSGAGYGPMVVPAETHGLVAAVWSASPFREADRAVARRAVAGWCGRFRAEAQRPVWLVTPPTAGRRVSSVTNTRLLVHNKELRDLASNCGAKIIPVYDVCRSALRRQKRWPARPAFSDTSGHLTAHGSYLMALAILDTLSLP